MLEIRVYGLPAPQGSKRHVGHGVMIESSKNVKPWREAVKWAAIEVRAAVKERDGYEASVITGPVSMEVTFTMPRPKKYARKLDVRPAVTPDLSKLVRSTEDALTESGAWQDDARVVECLSRKVYAGQHEDALEVPGAVIRIAEAR